jgi:hypothetical protein
VVVLCLDLLHPEWFNRGTGWLDSDQLCASKETDLVKYVELDIYFSSIFAGFVVS